MKTPIILAAIFLYWCSPCCAWSELSHHVIGAIAFEELTSECRESILELLKAHPDYETSFQIPTSVGDGERWRFGRMAVWPDIAEAKYKRPNWSYYPSVVVKIGNPQVFPEPSYVLPADSTLETKFLNLLQAIKLCRNIIRNKTQPASSRALALTWICHLIGNAHDPCHTGLLVSERTFPKGDRFGALIPIDKYHDLHWLWSGFPGIEFDEVRVLLMTGIVRDKRVWNPLKDRTLAQIKSEGLDPEAWIRRTQIVADRFVYCDEIVDHVKEWEASPEKKDTIRLSKELGFRVQSEGTVLLGTAAIRLSQLLNEDFGTPSK